MTSELNLNHYAPIENQSRHFLAVLDEARQYIAANEEGITRDETIAKQMIDILFCKMTAEVQGNDELFRSDSKISTGRIRDYFEAEVKGDFPHVFDRGDHLELTDEGLSYVAERISRLDLTGVDRDALGDAFEFFISPALKGSQGQFFTPHNAVDLMLGILSPSPSDKIIDPACGTGGFLGRALYNSNNGGSSSQVAPDNLYGIDKDAFLVRVAQARLSLLGDGSAQVACENSLKRPQDWSDETQEQVQLESFDLLVTNPPFGIGQKIKDNDILSQYDLARKWIKKDDGWERTDRILNQPAQVLFIERCLQLLRDGGRLGIVLPETFFGSPSYRYIMEYLRRETRILGILAMPEDLFQPYTHAKTCLLFLEKKSPEDRNYPIFMATAEWCGHDSRGNPTIKTNDSGDKVLLDDLPRIQTRYQEWQGSSGLAEDHLGFPVDLGSINNNIFVPRYYSPEHDHSLEKLRETHDLKKIGELIDEGLITIGTGVEPGRLAYGTGDIPFIRTSDIVNWEPKINPQHCVGEDIYEKYCEKCDLRPQDILLVKDGTSLIGNTAMVTEYDTRSLFQSHIYRIRVEDTDQLDPFLLFAALNDPIVRSQIKARQFTQQIIDSLSKERLREVVLPLPRDPSMRESVAKKTSWIVRERANLREEARRLMEDGI